MPSSLTRNSQEHSETHFAPDDPGAAKTLAFLLSLRAKGIRDTVVLRAMEVVPRALFAPARCADLAGADVSLPLACGQTMLSPGIVATLLSSLKCQQHHRVLEIGTGSGYVTALLAQLTQEVVSIERYRSLAIAAAERLAGLGEKRATIAHLDGLAISREFGLFDRILLTGTVQAFPTCLMSALQPAGIMVGIVPVDGLPRLVTVTRTETGAFHETRGGVMRVPPLVEGIGQSL